MAVTRATKGWTVADLEALPYDEWHRYEIIDGELFVSTAPRREHQLTCLHVSMALVNWNDQSGLGEIIPGAGVIFTEKDSVEPDVLWVSHERLAAVLDEAGHLQGAPELCVEVLSPGSTNQRRDREAKLNLYGTYGVEEYWLLDWRTQTVAIYRPEASRPSAAGAPATRGLELVATLGRDDTLTSPVLPGFAVVVARLFGRG